MKIRKIRLFLIILWFFIAGLIVWLKVLPFGHATYSRAYPDEFALLGGKGFIGRLSPIERLSTSTNNVIIGDPVYFSIFTPRTFNEVKLTFKYRPALTGKTPIIEAGVLVDNVVWRYKMAPLQNDILDNNFSSWNRLSDKGVVILQKDKIFDSAAEAIEALGSGFKNYCPNPSKCLAWYNADDLASNIQASSFRADPFQELNIPLQGAHQFYFISSSSPENSFFFNFSDLNLNRDADNIEISIYHGNEKVFSELIKDESSEEESGKVRDFGYGFTDLFAEKDVLHKLEIKANNDIVIKGITEAPSALTAISRLHPVSSPSKPLSFWTDSSYIQATAVTPAARQEIRFGNKEFNLNEAYQQFEFSNSDQGLKEVRLEKDDVIIENNGIFSFASNSGINPGLKKIDRHFAIDNDVKFVVARYEAPRGLEGDWKEASVILNTKEAYREKGKYGFIISVPGLSLAETGSLEIKEIKAEFSGRTIFDKILELFGNNEGK